MKPEWNEAGKRPNIVFVLTDDQGYGDLGCNGNPWVLTPHIDRFYEESMRFTNFHVGPTCAPTRAGLLTGHYANSTGVWHTVGGRSLLRSNEWTLAAALQDNGYHTGIFGKWHLGDEYPYRPQDRGFATTVVHGGGGVGQTPDHWGNDYFDDTYAVNGEPKAFQGYCTDVFFNEALTFIEDNKDQPFFCYISTNAPHLPYNVEKAYSDLYQGRVPEERARFYGMITNIDENFGKLDRKLHELGLQENTILIFMTDNGTSGGCTIDGNGFIVDGYNAGLRGLKNTPYDGGHRVPFFIRWQAGGLAAGIDIDELTANIDFMPTLLDLCGICAPPDRNFHGISLKPLMINGADNWQERTLITDSQRLTVPMKWRESSVMTSQWRLINGIELYDIHADREQRNNIAAEHPKVVEHLRSAYDQWWELVSGQFDEEIPISLKTNRMVTSLNAHDWVNPEASGPWHQWLIRSGMVSNGYWEIAITEAGEYQVELRRWPIEADRAIRLGIEGDDIVWRKDVVAEQNWRMYTGGKALPIRHAKLQIGSQVFEKEVADTDLSVVFNVTLSEGPAHLQTWFSDGNNFETGAYYVYIEKSCAD